MKKTFSKNQTVFLVEELDMTATGGPKIPANTLATVLIRRCDGRLWVDILGFGKRHLYPNNVAAFKVSTYHC